MIVEDAWWIVDTGLSLEAAPENVASVVIRCLLPHFARVVYESDRYFARLDPSLADRLIERQHRPQLEAARHSVKLFDDRERGFEGLVEWFESANSAHQQRFAGGARTRSRSSSDLAVSTLNDRLVTTSLITNFCAGISPQDLLSRNRQRDLSIETGIVLGKFAGGVLRAVNRGEVPQPTLDIGSLGPASNHSEEDVYSESYYKSRFDDSLPIGLKAALTALEASAQTATSLFDATQSGHEDAILRARLIVSSHLLSSMQALASRWAKLISKEAMEGLAAVLGSQAARRIKHEHVRALRNIAIHYRFIQPVDGLDITLPMSGLIEAIAPSITYDQLFADVRLVCESSALFLHSWCPADDERPLH